MAEKNSPRKKKNKQPQPATRQERLPLMAAASHSHSMTQPLYTSIPLLLPLAELPGPLQATPDPSLSFNNRASHSLAIPRTHDRREQAANHRYNPYILPTPRSHGEEVSRRVSESESQAVAHGWIANEFVWDASRYDRQD